MHKPNRQPRHKIISMAMLCDGLKELRKCSEGKPFDLRPLEAESILGHIERLDRDAKHWSQMYDRAITANELRHQETKQ